MAPSSHRKHARYNNTWGNRPHYELNAVDAAKLAKANASVSHKHRKAIEASAPSEADCIWSK